MLSGPFSMSFCPPPFPQMMPIMPSLLLPQVGPAISRNIPETSPFLHQGSVSATIAMHQLALWQNIYNQSLGCREVTPPPSYSEEAGKQQEETANVVVNTSSSYQAMLSVIADCQSLGAGSDLQTSDHEAPSSSSSSNLALRLMSRGNRRVLSRWFRKHVRHPFPTSQDKVRIIAFHASIVREFLGRIA